MSDLLRRLNKVTDGLEELKNSSGVEFTDLSKEEQDSIKIEILIRAAKVEGLISADYKSPVCELAQQAHDKLKPVKGTFHEFSKEEFIYRTKRLKDMTIKITGHDEMKSIWEHCIKDIVYPF